MQPILRFLLRLVLVAAGLVFAACLLFVVACVAALWGLRYAWARLTGKPMAPFAFRMNPRAGFDYVYSAGQRGEAARPQRRDIADVTDVEAREPRQPGV